MSVKDIDLLILGNNGDVNFDTYYSLLCETLFKTTPKAHYKHLSGEFDTASAFGFWLAAKIIKTQTVPEVVKSNSFKCADVKTILIYNQYRGENHSLVLLRKC